MYKKYVLMILFTIGINVYAMKTYAPGQNPKCKNSKPYLVGNFKGSSPTAYASICPNIPEKQLPYISTAKPNPLCNHSLKVERYNETVYRPTCPKNELPYIKK